MTLQEAYKQAIEMPIKGLPNIRIVLGETEFVLMNNGEQIFISSTADDIDDEVFLLDTQQLLSENWEVKVV